jgi:hypothetical protein
VNLIGSEEILLQKSLEQNAAHLAGAKHGDADVGQLCGNTCGFYSDIGHGGFFLLRIELLLEYLPLLRQGTAKHPARLQPIQSQSYGCPIPNLAVRLWTCPTQRRSVRLPQIQPYHPSDHLGIWKYDC